MREATAARCVVLPTERRHSIPAPQPTCIDMMSEQSTGTAIRWFGRAPSPTSFSTRHTDRSLWWVDIEREFARRQRIIEPVAKRDVANRGDHRYVECILVLSAAWVWGPFMVFVANAMVCP